MRQELKSKFTSHWEYLTLRAACKLDLFDYVGKGLCRQEDLVLQTGAESGMLQLLLHALVTIGALEQGEKYYTNTEMGALLTASHPDSLKQAAILWGGEQMNAWQSLTSTIKTGKPAFEVLFGASFFKFLEAHPEKLKNYHLAMNEYAVEDYRNLASLYDFSIHKTLMDVGGGLGALLKSISGQLPNTNLVLFDRPQVLQLGENLKGITKSPGDFFESLPEGVDGIILSRVLHDWPDADAKKILRNCFAALADGGGLYVIENLTDRIEDSAALLSLNMAVVCESFERDRDAYLELLEDGGFQFDSELQVNNWQWMLIARK